MTQRQNNFDIYSKNLFSDKKNFKSYIESLNDHVLPLLALHYAEGADGTTGQRGLVQFYNNDKTLPEVEAEMIAKGGVAVVCARNSNGFLDLFLVTSKGSIPLGLTAINSAGGITINQQDPVFGNFNLVSDELDFIIQSDGSIQISALQLKNVIEDAINSLSVKVQKLQNASITSIDNKTSYVIGTLVPSATDTGSVLELNFNDSARNAITAGDSSKYITVTTSSTTGTEIDVAQSVKDTLASSDSRGIISPNHSIDTAYDATANNYEVGVKSSLLDMINGAFLKAKVNNTDEILVTSTKTLNIIDGEKTTVEVVDYSTVSGVTGEKAIKINSEDYLTDVQNNTPYVLGSLISSSKNRGQVLVMDFVEPPKHTVTAGDSSSYVNVTDDVTNNTYVVDMSQDAKDILNKAYDRGIISPRNSIDATVNPTTNKYEVDVKQSILDSIDTAFTIARVNNVTDINASATNVLNIINGIGTEAEVIDYHLITGKPGDKAIKINYTGTRPLFDNVKVGSELITPSETTTIEFASALGSETILDIVGGGSDRRIEINSPKSFHFATADGKHVLATEQNTLKFAPKAGSAITVGVNETVPNDKFIEIGVNTALLPGGSGGGGTSGGFATVHAGLGVISSTDIDTINVEAMTGTDEGIKVDISGTGSSAKLMIGVDHTKFASSGIQSASSTTGQTTVSITGQSDLKINPKLDSEITIEKTGTAGAEAFEIGLSKSIPNPAIEAVRVGKDSITPVDTPVLEIIDKPGSASTTEIIGAGSDLKVQLNVPKAFTSAIIGADSVDATVQTDLKFASKTGSPITIEVNDTNVQDKIVEIGLNMALLPGGTSGGFVAVHAGTGTINASDITTVNVEAMTGTDEGIKVGVTGTGANAKLAIGIDHTKFATSTASFTSLESTTTGVTSTISPATQPKIIINPKASSGITIEKTGTGTTEALEIGFNQSVLPIAPQKDYSEENVIYIAETTTTGPNGSYSLPFNAITPAISAYNYTNKKTVIKSVPFDKLFTKTEDLTLSVPVDLDLQDTTLTGDITLSVTSSALTSDNSLFINLKKLAGSIILAPVAIGSDTEQRMHLTINLDEFTCSKTKPLIKVKDLTTAGDCNITELNIDLNINNFDESLLTADINDPLDTVVPLIDLTRTNIENLEVNITITINTISKDSANTTKLNFFNISGSPDNVRVTAGGQFISKTKYFMTNVISLTDIDVLIIPKKEKAISGEIGEIFYDPTEQQHYGVTLSKGIVPLGISSNQTLSNVNLQTPTISSPIITGTLQVPFGTPSGPGTLSYDQSSNKYEVYTPQGVANLLTTKDMVDIVEVPYFYETVNRVGRTFDETCELELPAFEMKATNYGKSLIYHTLSTLLNLRTRTIDNTVFASVTTPLEKYTPMDNTATPFVDGYSSFLDLKFVDTTFTIADGGNANRELIKITLGTLTANSFVIPLPSGTTTDTAITNNVIAGCGYKLVTATPGQELAFFVYSNPVKNASGFYEFLAYSNIGHIASSFADLATAQAATFTQMRFGEQFHFQLDKGVFKGVDANRRESVVPHYFPVYFQTRDFSKTACILVSFVTRFSTGNFSGERQFYIDKLPRMIKDFVSSVFSPSVTLQSQVDIGIVRLAFLGGAFNVPATAHPRLEAGVTTWRSLMPVTFNGTAGKYEIVRTIGDGFYTIFECKNIFSNLTAFTTTGGTAGSPEVFTNSGIAMASIVGDCWSFDSVYITDKIDIATYQGAYLNFADKVKRADLLISNGQMILAPTGILCSLSDNNTPGNEETVFADFLGFGQVANSNKNIQIVKYMVSLQPYSALRYLKNGKKYIHNSGSGGTGGTGGGGTGGTPGSIANKLAQANILTSTQPGAIPAGVNGIPLILLP